MTSVDAAREPRGDTPGTTSLPGREEAPVVAVDARALRAMHGDLVRLMGRGGATVDELFALHCAVGTMLADVLTDEDAEVMEAGQAAFTRHLGQAAAPP